MRAQLDGERELPSSSSATQSCEKFENASLEPNALARLDLNNDKGER
jgi:hypothetical protein